MTRVVRVLVKKDGTIVLDFDGFRGQACFLEREKILDILAQKYGVRVDKKLVEQVKPEAFVEERQELEVSQ